MSWVCSEANSGGIQKAAEDDAHSGGIQKATRYDSGYLVSVTFNQQNDDDDKT